MTDNNKNIEIIPLPKEQWKGTPIPLVTKTDSYYDLEISPLDKDGCKINLIKKLLKNKLYTLQKSMISRMVCIRIIGKTQRLTVS